MTTTDLDAHRLYMIAFGAALAAEVENDLEERGLIVQTDKPYATLTDAGRARIAEEAPPCRVCGDDGHTLRGKCHACGAAD